MDIATIIGIVLAFGLVVGSIAIGGSMGAFINIPSLLIVVGGTIGVALIAHPLGTVIGSIKVAVNAMRFQLPNFAEQNQTLMRFANVARKEGILALEEEIPGIEEDFLQRGIQLLVDGVEPEKIESILYDEMYAMDSRHIQGAKIFESMGAVSPAMGLIGTLIGLVQMLQNMEDPSSIGPAMAVALLTTFYGAIMANMIFNPIAGKLRLRNDEEILFRTLIIKGLMGIASGENPHLLEQQLKAELAPTVRAQLGESGEQE